MHISARMAKATLAVLSTLALGAGGASALASGGPGAAPLSPDTADQSWTVGTPWTGSRAVQESTASIMARQHARATPPALQGRPRRLRGDRAHVRPNPAALSVAQWPPTTSPPAIMAPQVPAVSFTGATLADTHAFPPDSMGAVGPSQFLVGVNGRIRSFNKITGVADGAINTDTDVFFGPVMTPQSGTFTSDPRVRYDRLAQRWIIIMIDVPGGTGAGPNRVMLAVTDGPTITTGTIWSLFYFQQDTVSPAGDTNLFADYPTLGVDANALYIGVNLFGSTFSGTTAFVVRKSSLLAGGPIIVTAFRDLTGGPTGSGPYTPQGVDNYAPSATTGYLIGVDNATFGTLMLRRIANPGGTPSISSNISITVPATYFPISVPHLGNTGGTNGQLDALDDRLFAAHLRNGRLWTAHNIGVTSTGVASTHPTRDAVRWYELQNLDTTPALVQSGTIYDTASKNPLFYWIPSVMVSGQGHAAFGFSVAGNTSYANAATTGRLVGDPLGTLPTPVNYTASSTAYNPPGDPGSAQVPRRWGDYSYTSLDPCDDMTMWTIQEFCDSTNSYGVRVLQLLAPPPATPSAVTPSTLAANQAAITVNLTGTSTAGSGFYDPGPGFGCRLQAGISGGVTVTSAAYVDPTHVNLVVSTVGASAGPQSVTVTNPDGQSSSASGLITVLPPAPTITGWSSVRTHAGFGELAIALNPLASGNGGSGPSVETRQGGVQKIQVTFTQAVTLTNPAAISVTGVTQVGGVAQPPVTYTPASASMTAPSTLAILFNAGQLPDQTCYTLNLAGAVQDAYGQALTGDTSCNVRSLVGDVTGNGGVNLGDVLYLRSLIAASPSSFPAFDVNLSGAIDLNDELAAKALIGNATICP